MRATFEGRSVPHLNRLIHLRSTPIVVTENPADTLAATNDADRSLAPWRFDQFVSEPLMIPLVMIVPRELLERHPQVPFPDRDDPIQALLFYRPDESLRVGVAVGRTRRRADHANPHRVEELLHASAPFHIAVADHNLPFSEKTIWFARNLPQTLNDERLVRIWCGTDHRYATGLQFDDEGCVVRHQPARGPYFR